MRIRRLYIARKANQEIIAEGYKVKWEKSEIIAIHDEQKKQWIDIDSCISIHTRPYIHFPMPKHQYPKIRKVA